MSEQPEKKKVVEWSFSFEKLGDSINEELKKIGSSEEVKEAHYAAGLEGAISATVELDLSIGQTTIKALENSDNLFEADVKYTGEMTFEAQGEAQKYIHLAQKRTGADVITAPLKDVVNRLANHEDLRWDVRL